MDKKSNTSTRGISFLPKIVEAALAGNRQRVELLTLNSIRAFKTEAPEVAHELGGLLARFSANNGAMRWHLAEPPPADVDGGLALLRVERVDDAVEPTLASTVSSNSTRFLRQRKELDRLMQEGVPPPRTLLLKGPPGTGKTMLARWIARELKLPFVALDLATSISSFLGKTGANLRRSLDYARGTPCVILLDEFDAIAKRRDDATEVGELKRIVNVLLKELEEWPFHSVLIAATNHPESLDPAIHRRFDVVIDLPIPGKEEREKIIAGSCGRFASQLPAGFVATLADALDGMSGSELDTITQGVVRQHIIDRVSLTRAFVAVALQRVSAGPRDQIPEFARTLKETTNLSVRDIAELTGKSSSTIQYHLTKPRRKRKEGPDE